MLVIILQQYPLISLNRHTWTLLKLLKCINLKIEADLASKNDPMLFCAYFFHVFGVNFYFFAMYVFGGSCVATQLFISASRCVFAENVTFLCDVITLLSV